MTPLTKLWQEAYLLTATQKNSHFLSGMLPWLNSNFIPITSTAWNRHKNQEWADMSEGAECGPEAWFIERWQVMKKKTARRGGWLGQQHQPLPTGKEAASFALCRNTKAGQKKKKKEESNGSPIVSKNNCKKTVGNSSVVKKIKIFNLTVDEITLIHILFFQKN